VRISQHQTSRAAIHHPDRLVSDVRSRSRETENWPMFGNFLTPTCS
jgi:hypothetical protein